MGTLKIALSLACILSAIFGAETLKCLKCFSYKSMEDCDTLRGSIECKPEFDRCRNATVHVYSELMKETVTGYELGCGRSQDCQQGRCEDNFGKRLPGVIKVTKCDEKCCEGDLCPVGKNATYRTPKPSLSPAAKGARGGAGPVGVWSPNLLMFLAFLSFVGPL